MSAHCHQDHCDNPAGARDPRYRRILWAALVINAVARRRRIGADAAIGIVTLGKRSAVGIAALKALASEGRFQFAIRHPANHGPYRDCCGDQDENRERYRQSHWHDPSFEPILHKH